MKYTSPLACVGVSIAAKDEKCWCVLLGRGFGPYSGVLRKSWLI